MADWVLDGSRIYEVDSDGEYGSLLAQLVDCTGSDAELMASAPRLKRELAEAKAELEAWHQTARMLSESAGAKTNGGHDAVQGG